jgi:biopolymer transport protein ExbD
MNRRRLSIAAASWLVRLAAGYAPDILGERLQEEWLADLSEQNGLLAQLYFAIGCFWAAARITHDHLNANSCSSSGSVAFTADHVMTATAHPGPARYSHCSQTPVVAGTAICDINITPLIDVMLVLLVTLILSLPIMTHAVKIDMAVTPAASLSTPPEVVDLDIDGDGTVVWNGTQMHSLAQLESQFQNAALREPQPEIHVRPDPHVKYDIVAKVLASAQRNQMRKIAFANTATFDD